MRTFTLFIAFICLGWTVKAQDTLKTVELDEVVFLGSKTEIPVEKSGKTIFKITRNEIEQSSGKEVADLLNEIPGIQMDGNFGPLGTNIGYFVRGASSKQTLIMIDGVPFNDASGIDQTYDLRLLDLDQVESIEVLKGGLGALYGTGAAAGVINIQLKEAGSEAISGKVGAAYGSFNTFKSHLNVNGRNNNFSYLFNGGYQRSDGFSAALNESGISSFDDDGFEGVNFLGKVSYQFSDAFDLGFSASLDDFENDYDQGVFADGDNFSEYRQLRLGLTPKLKIGSGSLITNIFYSQLDRLFNSPDFFDPSARFIDEYEAENIQVDAVIDQNLTDNIKLIGGVNYQNFSYAQPSVDEESFYLLDPYLSFIYDRSNFTFQFGGRVNTHSEYGVNFVFNVNPSYLVNLDAGDIKLYGSYSTSFVAPSLFQLFGPFGANPDLTPEESESAEGGVSFLSDIATLNFVYFYRKDNNLIQFLNEGYGNSTNEIETSGVELNGRVEISENIQFNAHYTYINALGDAVIFRIPTHKYGASLNFSIIKDLDIRTTYLRTGDRDQPFFNNETFMTEVVNTSAFGLVDISANYKIGKFVLNGAVNNLLDEDYVAIYGFNAIGINYNLGMNYSF